MTDTRYRRLALTTICACACGGLTAAEVDGASTYTARVIGGAWFAELGGEFTYDGEFVDGETFDADELDLDETEISPMVEVGLNLPLLFDLHAGYFAYGVEGSATVTDPGFFNDVPVAGRVRSEIELTDIYGEIMWRVLNLELGGAGIGLAVHYIDAVVDIDSDLGQERAEESFPVPALSARAFVNPWNGVSVEGKLHLMVLEIGDVDAEYVDFHALVGYRPIEWIGIEAGYRLVSYDFDVSFDGNEHLALDFSLSGPFVGARVQF